MARQKHVCPACQRPFRKILDYPQVRVLSFERLPVPEAVDTMSEAAAKKQLARKRRDALADPSSLWHDGINLTPQIEQACNLPQVVQYFRRLQGAVGKVVKPRRLLPTKPSDTVFKFAYPIAETGLYLALDESDEPSDDHRLADVEILCEGPNLGSAGGPTLQSLGPIARIAYEGLLAVP